MAKIISIVNHKGGVGKTTTTVNLGAALAQFHNQKVLLLDMDSQANLTTHFGIFEEPEVTMFEVLQDQVPLNKAIIHRPPVHLVASKLDLAGSEIALVNRTAREMVLRRALKNYEDQFDIILIDCPPSFGILTLNALTASDYFYIIVQTEFFALHGLSRMLEEIIEVVKENLNERLALGGVVATMYDRRRSLHNDVLEQLNKMFGKHMLETVVRVNTHLSEASAEGQTIFEYSASCRGSVDYKSLAAEVFQRIQQDQAK